MVFNLIILNASNEDGVEVFVNTYATLEKAFEAQEKFVRLEQEERADEELTLNEYEFEKVLIDENGGYVTFTVQETEVE